jgi:hypothetical protein
MSWKFVYICATITTLAAQKAAATAEIQSMTTTDPFWYCRNLCIHVRITYWDHRVLAVVSAERSRIQLCTISMHCQLTMSRNSPHATVGPSQSPEAVDINGQPRLEWLDLHFFPVSGFLQKGLSRAVVFGMVNYPHIPAGQTLALPIHQTMIIRSNLRSCLLGNASFAWAGLWSEW